ncbi:NAD(P)-dependent dehydrogenase, short-chain alcohol dehydrogenase family [Natronorubrum sediminis]|uniref:NAD(P)-dependent dehydrogenase, short-chain alcohol dehydrogenase family n=1 Tax=Natronorubrum sediminis TaxID=640943 RepID=A0A1H6G6D0_9EURY|nr:SDR family NAD(P)-dependent oxidoreductase [Natronorubrum sediminis]SEH18190.1 NAD(P)-dependent dehydrogenase, short-chain alcohol dehydrogenase family [Natronorubrum sediminis]
MLDGLTAYVTGGSQGIGRHIALELADAGASVAVAARGDGIYDTAEQIGDDQALAVKTDVTDVDSITDSFERTAEEFGGIDCVVNNAGIGGPHKTVEELSLDEWEDTLRVNLTGAFLVSKHALPYLKESNQASLVNISSTAAKDPYPTRTPYSASKAGMIGFSRDLAYEWGEYDITVNTICPGAVEGERIERMIEKQADKQNLSVDEAKRKRITGKLPLDSIVDPEDIGAYVVYLASDRARNITAQDINIDSGSRQD